MSPTTIADRYAVERAVGRGGMGTVWLCRDELLGRLVAIKEVGSMPGTSTSDLARALREARNSAALNHRNVVSIFDAVEDGERNWLVMEYVPSRNLSEMVAEEGALQPERVVWIGAQAADGLAAAHARGTMHRDVKPGNMLVTDDDHVKISDFGIARTHGDAQLTRSGVVTGTPAYFAPELAKGHEPTFAADVWGLGASLYAAVEGRLPYPEHTNAIALLTCIASEPPVPPEKAGFLAEPISRMMDADPSTRWTMSDAAHALHRLHEQHGIRSTGPSTASLTAPFATPSREGANDVTTQTDAETVPAGTTGLPTEATTPPTPDPPLGTRHGGRDRRGRTALAAGVLLIAFGALGAYALNQGDGDSPSAGDAPSSSRTPGASSSAPATGGSSSDDSGSGDSEDSDGSSDTGEGNAASDPGQFVKDYYSHLPSDTKTAWSLLSPATQDQVGSYGNYTGFWRTVQQVRVDKTTPVEDGVIDVELTYTTGRGTESETRRLRLEKSGDSFLITGDQAT